MKQRATGLLGGLMAALLLSCPAAAQEASDQAQDEVDAQAEAAGPEAAAEADSEQGEAGSTATQEPSSTTADSQVRPPEAAAARSSPRPVGAACLVGQNAGVAWSDSETAALLVCRELRWQGVKVGAPGEPGIGARAAYRVKLRRLGNIYLLDVSHESPVGMVVDSRNVQLASLEELPVAAARVAAALIQKKPVAATAKVNSIFGDEARVYPKKHGEFLYGLGVFGLALVGEQFMVGAGPQGQLFHETSDYSVGGSIRLGSARQGDESALLFGLSFGGRYFFNPTDISPYLGGGLGFHLTKVESRYREETEYSYYSRREDELTGKLFGAYLSAGFELLRLYNSRLDFELRVDLPFNQLEPSSYNDRQLSARYVVPVSLAAAYSWDD
jgi:hypothetical protein